MLGLVMDVAYDHVRFEDMVLYDLAAVCVWGAVCRSISRMCWKDEYLAGVTGYVSIHDIIIIGALIISRKTRRKSSTYITMA